MSRKLNWNKLINKRCPSCGGILEFFDGNDIYKCLDCDFLIAENRYDNLVKEIKEKELNRFS